MKINTALQAAQRLYVDTAPLIYYFEENSAYIAKMDRIFGLIATTPVVACSAVHILTEIMVKPLQTGNQQLAQEYRDILVNSDAYTLVPITVPIADVAADLRARYNLRTPNTLHVATAITTGCAAMLTNDVRLKRVQELPILVLDELET